MHDNLKLLLNTTMSDMQKCGPGKPKGTKNRPGAKAGGPRKNPMKTMGSNPHHDTTTGMTLPSQNSGMYYIFQVEVEFLFLIGIISGLAPSAHANANFNSTLTMMSYGQLSLRATALHGIYKSLYIFFN